MNTHEEGLYKMKNVLLQNPAFKSEHKIKNAHPLMFQVITDRYTADSTSVDIRNCEHKLIPAKLRTKYKQKTDIGKYSFVNRTIELWNQLPADVLETLSCKPSNFRKRIRKVINKAK
jgi:hypothetical protein